MENNKKVDVIGFRTVVPVAGFWVIVVCAAVMLLGAIIMFSIEDMEFAGWAFLCVLPIFIGVSFFFKPNLQNNKCKNPTIGLTEDGNFVLYYPKGTSEEITGTITDVYGKRHVEMHSTSSAAGNVVTTTSYAQERTWGQVVFTVLEPSGQRVLKTVPFVTNCLETAAKINEIRAQKEKPAITKFEKKRMFCQYCAAKIKDGDVNVLHAVAW